MRRFLLINGLLLVVFYPGCQAWGGDSPSPEDAASSSYQLDAPLFQTSITRTFAEAPNASSRLRDLLPDSASPRAQGLLAETIWLNGTFLTETEVAHSQGEASWLQGTIPGSNPTNASSRMVRFGLTGTQKSFRYGLTYRKAGQGFLTAQDQTRREIWGEWKRRWATVRSAVGQLMNNLTGDATRPRLKQTYGRMGFTLAGTSWPELSITYAYHSLRSALEPFGIEPQRTQDHTLHGTLAYHRPHWNIRLGSRYVLSRDLFNGGAQRTVRMETLTASFTPLHRITIAPMFTYRQELQSWSGVYTDNPSASFSFHYKQSPRLQVSAMAKYASSRSSDGLVDHESLGGKGILRWEIERLSAWNAIISLEARYNRLTDRVLPAAGTEDITGLVRFVLAAR